MCPIMVIHMIMKKQQHKKTKKQNKTKNNDELWALRVYAIILVDGCRGFWNCYSWDVLPNLVSDQKG